jgi:hypothetical protein
MLASAAAVCLRGVACHDEAIGGSRRLRFCDNDVGRCRLHRGGRHLHLRMKSQPRASARCSSASAGAPVCPSPFFPTCCGTAAAMPWRMQATIPGRCKLGSGTRTSSTRFAIPNFRLPASATSGGRMAVKRVRAAVTGLQDERNRLGWRPVASALENGRWRLLDGPVCARSPLPMPR